MKSEQLDNLLIAMTGLKQCKFRKDDLVKQFSQNLLLFHYCSLSDTWNV